MFLARANRDIPSQEFADHLNADPTGEYWKSTQGRHRNLRGTTLGLQAPANAYTDLSVCHGAKTCNPTGRPSVDSVRAVLAERRTWLRPSHIYPLATRAGVPLRPAMQAGAY
jgi:hypothetical protein